MTDKDFRYAKGDVEIEAFQMTPANRYAEKEWPAWMDSRWLLTIDGEEWLDHAGKELAIPPLGWICNNPDGTITVRGAMDMEEWAKVVPHVLKVVTPAADGMPDESHLAAAFPQHVPEGRTAADYKRKVITADDLATDNSNLAEIIDQGIHEQLVAPVFQETVGVNLVAEVYTKLRNGNVAEGQKILRIALTERVIWCDCKPLQCDESSQLGCRIKSPLL